MNTKRTSSTSKYHEKEVVDNVQQIQMHGRKLGLIMRFRLVSAGGNPEIELELA